MRTTKTLKVPKEFQIFGTTWVVKFDNDYCDSHGVFGMCDYNQSTIFLADKTHGVKRPKDAIEAVFYHELTHAICDAINERDLSSNERFVDNFGNALHQVIKSSK